MHGLPRLDSNFRMLLHPSPQRSFILRKIYDGHVQCSSDYILLHKDKMALDNVRYLQQNAKSYQIYPNLWQIVAVPVK